MHYYKSSLLLLLVMLVFAIFPMPYSYYVSLRLFTSISLVLFIYVYHKILKPRYITVLLLVIIFYNPIFRVHLNKALWIFLNLSTILIVYNCFIIVKTRSKTKLFDTCQSENIKPVNIVEKEPPPEIENNKAQTKN